MVFMIRSLTQSELHRVVVKAADPPSPPSAVLSCNDERGFGGTRVFPFLLGGRALDRSDRFCPSCERENGPNVVSTCGANSNPPMRLSFHSSYIGGWYRKPTSVLVTELNSRSSRRLPLICTHFLQFLDRLFH